MEIERKFLVIDNSWKADVSSSSHLCQGYLNLEQRCSVRVRTDGQRGWLNIKGATIGARRQEFEYPIPLNEAEQLLKSFAVGPLIDKTRYLVPFGTHIWEIDVFAGENEGLVVAEIELDDPEQPFERPTWLGREVTDDIRYYNTSLSRHPYLGWSSSGQPGMASGS